MCRPCRALAPACGDCCRSMRAKPARALVARTGERIPPCGGPSAVCSRTDVARSPACSQGLRMVVSLGTGVSNPVGLRWSKHEGLAPSRIPCALVPCESTVAHGAMASAPLRSCLTLYECGAACGSALGSRACRDHACRARSCSVGRPRGRCVPGGCGRDTRRSGRARSPRCGQWCLANPGGPGSVQRTVSTPGVCGPWWAVTRRTARDGPRNEGVRRCCQACTVCHWPACVAVTRRACSRRTVSLTALQWRACQAVAVWETAPADDAAIRCHVPGVGASGLLGPPHRRDVRPLARRVMWPPVSSPFQGGVRFPPPHTRTILGRSDALPPFGAAGTRRVSHVPRGAQGRVRDSLCAGSVGCPCQGRSQSRSPLERLLAHASQHRWLDPF